MSRLNETPSEGSFIQRSITWKAPIYRWDADTRPVYSESGKLFSDFPAGPPAGG